MKQIINHAFWESHALLLARIVFGGYFVYSGITKVTGGIDATAGYIASMGLPAAALLAWVAVLIEVVCGALLITGVYFKEAALVLAAFIIIISFIFHGPNTWSPENMQQVMFFKNMCMSAGLLFMAAHGAGKSWKLNIKK
jgi:putative oxidoreductase